MRLALQRAAQQHLIATHDRQSNSSRRTTKALATDLSVRSHPQELNSYTYTVICVSATISRLQFSGAGTNLKVGRGREHTSGARRRKIFVFALLSTISRFDERLRDGQYSVVSFLFAVLLLTVPPRPAICKSGGTCPRAYGVWSRRHCFSCLFARSFAFHIQTAENCIRYLILHQVSV